MKKLSHITVFAARNDQELDTLRWKALLNEVPEVLHAKMERYVRWQDRQASLLGKLLLGHGLKKYGYSPTLLTELQISKYSRPSLSISLDFNISHSGEYVVCTFAPHPIGIDVERIRPIKPYDFRSVLTETELDILNKMQRPEDLFFEIWSKKEAAIKAEGKGFSNSLKQINALGELIFLEDQWWHLKEVDLDEAYKCYVAAPEEMGNVEVEVLRFFE